VIGSTRNLSVWAYPSPVDLRNGYDGLSAIVEALLRKNPLSGDCYLFTNRTRTRCKVLLWDGTGLCIYQKRMERGRFACLWEREKGGAVELTISELALFLEGSSALARTALSPARFILGPVPVMRSRSAARNTRVHR
jgi:transposase